MPIPWVRPTPQQEPYFSNQDSLQNDRLIPVIGHSQAAFFVGYFQWMELHHPVTVVVGDGRLLLACKFNGDLGIGRVKSPYRHHGLSLQDHVVRERYSQLQYLLGGR